jgi:hypothetical protein
MLNLCERALRYFMPCFASILTVESEDQKYDETEKLADTKSIPILPSLHAKRWITIIQEKLLKQVETFNIFVTLLNTLEFHFKFCVLILVTTINGSHIEYVS